MDTVAIHPGTADRPELRGYVATPSTPGPWPGVLVIHEAWGLDGETALAADRLAAMGFLALAPDLYRGHPLRCIRAVIAAMASGRGQAMDDLDAARAWLVDHEQSTGATGVIGFCMGGGFALLLAGTGDYAVSSVNYGQLPKDLDVMREACPIVASYGGKDTSLKDAAATLDEALTRFGVEHDVAEYPRAGHAFLNERNNAPLPLRPLTKLIGGGPEPESAADAWARIESFFHRHLDAAGA